MHPLCKDTNAGRSTKLTLCAHLVRLLHLNSFRCPALSVRVALAMFRAPKRRGQHRSLPVFTGHGVRLYRGGYRYAFTPPLSIAHAITLRASPPQGHPNTTLLGFRVCPQTPGRLKYFRSLCAQSRRHCNETKRDRNADRREALRPSARKKRRPV